ncbi:MAG: hypothetical protein KAQ97_04180 [Candidatus Fermentibacteraceae bacterium]|nr:hypothetical protein [Candidatus Fermentibacteraceae bacterium]
MRVLHRIGLYLAILVLLITACDEPDSYTSIPENDLVELREWSGIMARHWMLPTCDSLHAIKPDSHEIQALIILCDSHPEAWAYLYSCIADTLSILEPPLPECQR